MQVPKALRVEYETFLRESGHDSQDPQALLTDLASFSMEVYLKEISWLSDFIGRIERTGEQAA